MSYSCLIFLAYKSRDIEDEILAVMARLVVLLYVCHVSFIVAENLLIQADNDTKADNFLVQTKGNIEMDL